MMGNIFTKGQFQIDPNMSPEQIATRRALMAALRPRFGSAKYVGEGLGQLATGIVMGKQDRKLDQIESAGRERADSLFSGLLGLNNVSASTAGTVAPMSILGVMPEYDQNSPEGIANDTMAALGKSPQHDHATHAGQSHADWLKYSNQGAIRNDPLDPKLIDAMSFVGGMGITMDVVSGGQESNKPGQGTGSTRHNHGQSADVDFYKDGRKLDWNNPQDLPILQEIVRNAKARGVTGIGAGDDYMGAGRFHVGFGAPAVWGAGGKSANAPSWLVEAYNGSPSAPSPAANAATPAIPTDQLLAALGSSWFSPEQRQVLMQIYDQQVQAGDPMNQMEAEKARLELEAMKNPAPEPLDFNTFTGPDGTVYRFNPATGVAEPLTGPEPLPGANGAEYGLAPVWGTDESGNLVLMQIGKDGTAVETKLPEGVKPDPAYKAFETSRGGAEGKAAGEDAALLASTASKMDGLETVVSELDTLADQATYTYAGQAFDWLGKQVGAEPRDAAVARAEYIAKVDNQVLPMLRDTFGAAFTVKEGETLRATLGDPNKSPQEKKAVLRAFIEQKKRDVAALEARAGATGATPSGATVIDGYTIEAIE